MTTKETVVTPPAAPVTPPADQTKPAGEVTPPVVPPAEPPKETPPAEPPKDSSSPEDKSKETPAEVKYELKLPENALLKKEDVDALVAFSKEKGLAPEVAQVLLDREHSAVARFRQAQLEAFNKQADTWRNEAKADKELGGNEENLKKTGLLVSAFIKKFGTEKLQQELESTSLGNHPELSRLILRASKAMGEDTFITAPKDAAPKPKSDSELFYPKKD